MYHIDMANTNNVDNKTKKEEITADQEFPYSKETIVFDDERDNEVPWHWHPYFELFYIDEGKIEYTIEGLGPVIFDKGEAGIINTNILHMTRALKKTVQDVHLFSPYFLDDIQGIIYKRYISPFISSNIKYIKITDPDIIDFLKRSYMIKRSDTGYELILRNTISEIYLYLYKEHLSDLDDTRSNDTKIKEVLSFIYECFGDDIDADDMAMTVGISKRALYRLFKSALDMTPNGFLNLHRIKEARRRLLETDDQITDIAIDCGFNSVSYFCKVFKDETGISPLKFRNLAKY